MHYLLPIAFSLSIIVGRSVLFPFLSNEQNQFQDCFPDSYTLAESVLRSKNWTFLSSLERASIQSYSRQFGDVSVGTMGRYRSTNARELESATRFTECGAVVKSMPCPAFIASLAGSVSCYFCRISKIEVQTGVI